MAVKKKSLIFFPSPPVMKVHHYVWIQDMGSISWTSPISARAISYFGTILIQGIINLSKI